MIIDLTSTSFGKNFMKNSSDDNKIITDLINSSIIDINKDRNIKFDIIVMPLSVYNIVEFDDRFHIDGSIDIDPLTNYIYIGSLFNIKCYVDLKLPSDKMLLTLNKQKLRESKIDSLLNDVDMINEISIDIRY